MFDPNTNEMNPKDIKSELSNVFGIKDFSDCLDLKDLQAKLNAARDSQLATCGHRYGPLIQEGNKTSPSGLVILSHGLGDSGEGWQSVGIELSHRLPHLLFLLPTAPFRSVTINGGMSMPAWYDIFQLSKSLMCSKQDGEGVQQSARYLTSLANLTTKKFQIPSNRVVYAGFSQGAALSLAAGLTAKVCPAGIAVMSGYLAAYSVFKPFMVNKPPVALFHGRRDEVVPFQAAQETQETLKKDLNIDAPLRGYDMEHSALPEEINDLRAFLEKVLPPLK